MSGYGGGGYGEGGAPEYGGDRGLFGHGHGHHRPEEQQEPYQQSGGGYGHGGPQGGDYGHGGPQGGGYGHSSGGYEPQHEAQRISKNPSHNEEVFKIVCEANPSFNLTERGGELVLAPGNESNAHQQWLKDSSHSSKKDKEDKPAFALINKASGLALYHDDKKDKVYLKPYNQNDRSESFLWTQSADVGHGYQCIRPFTDIHLNLDALRGDKDHGGVKDGTEIILHKWNKQENQKWKILPITTTGAFGAQAQAASGMETLKLSCEAKPDYFLTARGDSVVLAAGEMNDPRQEWIKDSRLAGNMKDEVGSPAFALINKSNHMALQHGTKEFDKVGLAPVRGNHADDSILWTLSADVGRGSRCLRPVRDTNLNLDASHGDEKHGGVHDGTELILYKWLKRENQKWQITYV